MLQKLKKGECGASLIRKAPKSTMRDMPAKALEKGSAYQFS
jgi:hypothetical protein